MEVASHTLDTRLTALIDSLLLLRDRYEPMVEQLEHARQLAETFTPADRDQARAQLLPLMTRPDLEPDPYRRAAYGRVLGILDVDQRPGIGLNADGLPDIDWLAIPAGEFRYQQDQDLHLPTFYISRYHITWRQFEPFLKADDGFRDPRWWDGLADRKERHAVQQTPPEQVFRFWNHPFDGACWYDAIAFCRWWSYRLGGPYALEAVMDWKVRLPTEQEWEKAARGTDGRLYPWGNTFLSGYANFDETDRYNLQTDLMKIRSGKIGERYYGAPTAGGIFPQGASPYGVMDMVGTMWDLTLTLVRGSRNDDLVDYYPRVIRGGTWFTTEFYGNVTERVGHAPDARTNGDLRKNDYSFRVCTSVPVPGMPAP